jgi:hypothetical protein
VYFDEDSARDSLVHELRARGADLVTPIEASMTGKTDDEQLEWAALRDRIEFPSNWGK